MKLNNGYLIIALIGPAGCGKDTLLNEVLNISDTQFHRIVQWFAGTL